LIIPLNSFDRSTKSLTEILREVAASAHRHLTQTAKAIAKVANMKVAGIGFSLSMTNCDQCETSNFRISCNRAKQYSR
jgi:hypothetical protein